MWTGIKLVFSFYCLSVFFYLFIQAYLLIHLQAACLWSVVVSVLLVVHWQRQASGVGRSACSGEGITSVEVPSSHHTGSSLQLTALLSKVETGGMKARMRG